jgi:hypothetical protein
MKEPIGNMRNSIEKQAENMMGTQEYKIHH